MSLDAEALCRVHELHYQTKARADGFHENFWLLQFCVSQGYEGTSPQLSYKVADWLEK
jgi:hypothetical protein